MTDQPATGGTPGAGGTPSLPQPQLNGQAKDGAGGTPAAGGTPTTPDDYAELRQSIRAERDARKAAEESNKDLSARLRALETKDLPEAERATRELGELRDAQKGWDTERRELRGELDASLAAISAGVDPKAVKRVWRMIRDDVDWAKDGTPKDIDKLVAELVKDMPNLLERTRPTGDVGQGAGRGPSGAANDMNTLLRRAAGRS